MNETLYRWSLIEQLFPRISRRQTEEKKGIKGKEIKLACRTNFLLLAKNKLVRTRKGDSNEIEEDYLQRVSVFGLSLPFRVPCASISSVSYLLRRKESGDPWSCCLLPRKVSNSENLLQYRFMS